MENHRILIIDFTDFQGYPIGGYLTFAKNMMESFGSDLALAGITTSPDDPVGKWFKKSIDGFEFDFFAMARYDRKKSKNLIPDRLVNFLLAKYYKRRILGIGISNIFLQRHESLLAIADNSKNICYSFPGLENPLSIAKYRYASLLAVWFERWFFKKIIYARAILARGDDGAIADMLSRSRGALANHSITKFPTRISTSLFKPSDKAEARKKLQLPPEAVIVVTTGRLAWLKGWKFMIDSFSRFASVMKDSHLIIVGDGEDFLKIKSYISENKLADKVSLTGKKGRDDIALYLNASDLYIMGSFKEGWPTALMEAVACGVPSCVTEFSAVDEIVLDGVNGFIVRERNEDRFAAAMLDGLRIKRPVKNDHITRYSTENLKRDLMHYWKLT